MTLVDVAEVQHSRAYHVLVSIGLASYGLLHLVVAWIAVQVAFGKKGDASNQGALAQLTKQPLGAVLLWVMAVGLFTLTIWQVLEAAVGREHGDRGHRIRRRISSAGRAVVYLGLGVLTVQVASGSGSHSGKGEQTLSARLMSVPFGRVLVAAVGAAVIAVGAALVVKGVKKKFTEDLASNPGQAARPLGTVGYCAKGVALGIIGALFGWAAITYDPKKAGGMDAALTTVGSQPFGTVLLIVMALGLACFGAYCFLWARRPRF
jgi:hypothetical protein